MVKKNSKTNNNYEIVTKVWKKSLTSAVVVADAVFSAF